jgi:hypothetical protein
VKKTRLAGRSRGMYSTGMDFKKVLTIVSGEFDRHGVVYALIGGMALGLRGVPRATVDIDFLIKKEDADAVKKVLRGYGFTCLYESENAAQYTSGLRPLGSLYVRIDVVSQEAKGWRGTPQHAIAV